MRIGAVEKGVPIPERNVGIAVRKYNVDFEKMDYGDSFVISVDAGKNLKGAVAYFKILAKRQGVELRHLIIDAQQARVWKVGEYPNIGYKKAFYI